MECIFPLWLVVLEVGADAAVAGVLYDSDWHLMSQDLAQVIVVCTLSKMAVSLEIAPVSPGRRWALELILDLLAKCIVRLLAGCCVDLFMWESRSPDARSVAVWAASWLLCRGVAWRLGRL